MVRAGAGLGAGLLALRYPQSLFWGEQSLQMAIDGVSAPEALLYPVALQGPRAAAPFGLGLGAAKLAAIALAAGAGCPGGVIFPLFFAAGAGCAFAFCLAAGSLRSLRQSPITLPADRERARESRHPWS